MRTLSLLLLLLLLFRAHSAQIETTAGTGQPGFSGDSGPATKAQLNNPYGLVTGPDGALYICDMGNHRIRKVDRNGIITTAAGSGEKGWTGDGGAALNASLNEPYEIRFDTAGNMFFVEMRNAVIRRVDAKTQLISTIAGTGKPGFSGDGGPAIKAQLNQPHSIQFVGNQLWICDIGNHRLRAIDLLTGAISTVGGTGEKLPTKEKAPLPGNPLNGPRAIDIGPDKTIWLALREGNAIYKVDPQFGFLQRIAGNGSQGFTGNGGPALQAALSGPKGITVSKIGLVIWADTESHSIRCFDPKKGTVELLAGTGKKADGKDGDALACELARPHGVFADAMGYLWIGDSENHKVRRLKLPE